MATQITKIAPPRPVKLACTAWYAEFDGSDSWQLYLTDEVLVVLCVSSVTDRSLATEWVIQGGSPHSATY
jgi:hypothetical protein